MKSPLNYIWKLIDGDYSASETLILLSLGYLMRDSGARVSRKFLSIKTGLSTSTVTRVIKSLKDKSIISVQSSKRDDGSTSINTYTFCDYTPTQSEQRGVAQRAGKYNNIITNINNTSFNKSKSKYNPSFLEVYNIYPKKPVGRTNKAKSATKYSLIKLEPRLILDAVKNRVTAYCLEHDNPKEFKYLESLQSLLTKDLIQFLTPEQHPDGEFILPDKVKQSINIKGTNLINTSTLLNAPFRSITEINKDQNGKQIK